MDASENKMKDLVLETIREQYAAFSDEQLLRFAEREAPFITDDAFKILRYELVKRKVGTHLIIGVKQEVQQQKNSEIFRLRRERKSRVIVRAIDMAYKQKGKGISNSDIVAALEATGIDPEMAMHIVDNLKSWAREMSDDLTDKIQLTIIKVCACGLIFYMLEKVVQFQITVGIYLLTNLVILLLYLSKRNDLNRIVQGKDKESNLSEN